MILKLCSIRQRYNLKANHNQIPMRGKLCRVVFNTSKIQFESKSQLDVELFDSQNSCVQYVKDTI